MKYILVIILLSINIITFGQIEKFDYPDTLLVYGSSVENYGLTPTNPI